MVRASILVATDGSASSFGAVRWAALEAGVRQWPLIIGSAADVPNPQLAEGGGAGTRDRSQLAVANAVQIARAVLSPEHDVSTQLWEGPPIPLLLERSHEVGLIVLGDRGLGDSPVVGSVTEAVATHAECPVVVVRNWSGAETGFGAGPIVVGVDGSVHCEAAVEQAMLVAAARATRVVAVHAWSDVPLDGTVSSLGSDASGVDWESFQQRHDSFLAETLAPWQEQFPDVPVERVVVNDRPVRHLAAAADDAQLVVLGNRGRGGFHGMLVGSTSRAMLHTCPCPLMIVKAK